MHTLLAYSLAVSAVLFTISCLVPRSGPTNWPMAVIAHLLWPITLLCVAAAVWHENRKNPDLAL